jgi:hypothetical protein
VRRVRWFAEHLAGREVIEGSGPADLESMAEDADRVADALDDPAVDDLATLVHTAARLSSGIGRLQGTLPRW